MDEERFKEMEFELGAAYSRISWLEKMATLDELTGLGNRRGLNEHLGRALSLADRQSSDLTLIAIDIDHFKDVNDTHGHIAGDKVLSRVAAAMQRVIRGGDCAFRQGGEEMTVVAVTTFKGAAILAEKLRNAVECSHTAGEPPVTISLGVSMARLGDTNEKLSERADAALYAAKNNGRNRVELG
jgi:diguanylate cyclase (GGDEF)-like protein